jgi:hypothetical protein
MLFVGTLSELDLWKLNWLVFVYSNDQRSHEIAGDLLNLWGCFKGLLISIWVFLCPYDTWIFLFPISREIIPCNCKTSGQARVSNLEILEVKGGGYQDLEGDPWIHLGDWVWLVRSIKMLKTHFDWLPCRLGAVGATGDDGRRLWRGRPRVV